jgi:hypothetical protein
MAQPARGGLSYSLTVPVPDVVSWHRQTLLRSGYTVIGTDVQGQDEFKERWLLFESRSGGGAVIVRPLGRSLTAATEVKILSRNDDRLTPPTVQASR